eukprot:GHVU01176962.1.p3 GENE.GHVU01176962.1~~GHVU01176962.1.p3  ORF type:complete len:140 (-),score=19.80 GHVU01176962.1:1980-2399(-)
MSEWLNVFDLKSKKIIYNFQGFESLFFLFSILVKINNMYLQKYIYINNSYKTKYFKKNKNYNIVLNKKIINKIILDKIKYHKYKNKIKFNNILLNNNSLSSVLLYQTYIYNLIKIINKTKQIKNKFSNIKKIFIISIIS